MTASAARTPEADADPTARVEDLSLTPVPSPEAPDTAANDDRAVLPPEQQRLVQAMPWLVAKGLRDVNASPLGGLSNDNWHLKTPKGDFVLRIPRPDPAGYVAGRGAEIGIAAAASLAGFGPELYAFEPETGLMLSRFIAGARPAAGADAVMIGKALGGLHRSSLTIERRFDPYALIRDYRSQLGSRDPLSRDLALALRHAEQLADHTGSVPSHGDAVPENLLIETDLVRFIDWEYAARTSPTWDLAYISVHTGMTPAEEADMLKAYGRRLFYGSQLRAAKLAVCLVGALWGLMRGDDAISDYVGLSIERAARIAEGW